VEEPQEHAAAKVVVGRSHYRRRRATEGVQISGLPPQLVVSRAGTGRAPVFPTGPVCGKLRSVTRYRYCLLWPDDENRVGELEPVGVRDEFRRRGLGAAVCSFALRRWHEEGGRSAIVYCVTDAACGLYESLGFRRHATLVGYSR